jgi:predicted nucleic acid-binding protein
VPDDLLFLDTNVFLRFLTNDNTRHADESRRLLERAEAGEFEFTTSHLTIAEIAWTLGSFYRLDRGEIAATLRDILGLRALRLEHRDAVREAVELYAVTNVDFIDAYNAAELRRRKLDRICSYDRDFDALGVERVEPADVVR